MTIVWSVTVFRHFHFILPCYIRILVCQLLILNNVFLRTEFQNCSPCLLQSLIIDNIVILRFVKRQNSRWRSTSLMFADFDFANFKHLNRSPWLKIEGQWQSDQFGLTMCCACCGASRAASGLSDQPWQTNAVQRQLILPPTLTVAVTTALGLAERGTAKSSVSS
jgi:hypothetical protein